MKKLPKNEKNQITKFLVKIKKEKEEEEGGGSVTDFAKNKISCQSNEKLKIEKVNDENELQRLKSELELEKKKNQHLEENVKKSVALVKEASIINLQKDIEIEQLNRRLKKIAVGHEQESDTVLFNEFNGIFNNNQLKELRSIASGKPNDFKFVRAILKFMYPDANALIDLSVTGKGRESNKSKMNPENVKIISKILHIRLLSEEGLQESEVLKRLSNVRMLIKDGIMKLKPKQANKSTTTTKPNNGKY